jgi:2-keto-4-pentenoate hydratase/2-oxohepta-3-ene-1,7-dioic acid hydratase in catechol pathway
MKLVTFRGKEGRQLPGVLEGDQVVDLMATDPKLPPSIRQILAADAIAATAAAARSAAAVRAPNVELAPPLSDPGKIICIGLNYRDHAIESGMPIPAEPVVFCKFASSIIGNGDAIILPPQSQQVDYEAELVVVIGRRARDIAVADAMACVAGYTLGNDVSARDWQLHKPGGQWLLGKSFATFAPIGPTITTADEISDPHALGIELRLNGHTMQRSTTAQLIFRIDALIAYLSQVFTLDPGDLIFTGTPPGVGFARKPPVFLKPGDVCDVQIEGLGVLRNPCIAK